MTTAWQHDTWSDFNWEAYDARRGVGIQLAIRLRLAEHRPPHVVREKTGFFGPECLACVTCQQILWSVEKYDLFDWN